MARNYSKLVDIQKLLSAKLLSTGYSDVSDFWRRGGLRQHISYETLRRTFVDSDARCHVWTLAIVMQHLGFNDDDIRTAMRSIGDTIYYTLISDSKPLWLQSANNLIVASLNAKPELMEGFVGYIDMMAMAANIDRDIYADNMCDVRSKHAGKVSVSKSRPRRQTKSLLKD